MSVYHRKLIATLVNVHIGKAEIYCLTASACALQCRGCSCHTDTRGRISPRDAAARMAGRGEMEIFRWWRCGTLLFKNKALARSKQFSLVKKDCELEHECSAKSSQLFARHNSYRSCIMSYINLHE